jgi:hypothetical protein
MTKPGYTSRMTPVFIPANLKLKSPPQIKVTGAFLETLKPVRTAEEMWWLGRQKTGESLCPEQYWFPDTPKVREILGIKNEESIPGRNDLPGAPPNEKA